MCRGSIDRAQLEGRHDIEFNEYFADSLERLQSLVADGLVVMEGSRITATSRGRLMLRIIAMCFDHYLPTQASAESRPRHSRAL
jgi:oxygen-independent coproporphyrinogen-3 oxidase